VAIDVWRLTIRLFIYCQCQIEEILVDCSGPAEQERSAATAFENKRLAMVRALDQSDAVRTLIFCNTINQCRNVENALKRIDRNGRVRSILPYHGALDAEKRQESIRNFIRPPLGKPAVLVCTDRASRGMDFDTASVDHIVLFDFPQEPSEYVRRVGRTGRAGRFGRATVLVHGRQVPIARRVMGASLQGKRIEPIPEMNAY
jgi:ATP-dependent RNA helicase DDX18/HAS1